jgi:S-DNA-T family DNA segregation ATPase FtsK/SpoIIIE
VSATVSVTEVRNALRCPRIFALGRRGNAAVAFPIGSSCLGGTFHRLVDRFAKTVDAAPAALRGLPTGTPLDTVDSHLRRWLLELLVDELASDASLATMPAEVDDLAQALRELAHHLAGRLQKFSDPPHVALRALLHDSERPLEVTLGDVVVRGKLDALYASPDGSLEVIEYKLTDEANDSLDRAQASLYREMLQRASGTRSRATVLRFMPHLRETSLSEVEADHIVAKTLTPLLGYMAQWADQPELAPATDRRDLCAACPLATPCSEAYPERVAPRDDPPAGATKPRPDTSGVMKPSAAGPVPVANDADDEGHREAAKIRELVLEDLRKQGIGATSPRAPTVGPTLYEIELMRPRGSVRILDSAAADVEHRLESEHGLRAKYERRDGRRFIVVGRKSPRKVYLTKLLQDSREYLAERPGRFVLGQQPNGVTLCGDFAESSTAHLLVAGATGSGKSVLLRSIVASLLQYHPPSSIRFVLVDPKRVTFNAQSFQAAVSAHLDGPTRYDAEEAIPVIEQLVDRMNERYELFAKGQVSDLEEYNETVAEPDRLARIVVIIDEFQDLTADKAHAKPFFHGVSRLGSKARAAGVHLVLATQRPDRETVPGVLKSNLTGKIALRVESGTNSRIVINEGGAERLLGKGDMLANLGNGLIRAQAPLIG